MDALSSVVEAVLEAFGKKNERESRPVVSTRVPSLRLWTADSAWTTIPVDMVVIGDRRYLLRPDVHGGEWATSLASARDVHLILSDGEHNITVSLLHDRDRPPVLREFAKRGTPASRGWRRMPEADLRRVSHDIPVFLITDEERV